MMKQLFRAKIFGLIQLSSILSYPYLQWVSKKHYNTLDTIETHYYNTQMKHSSLFKKPSNWGHRSITCNHSQATTQHFKAYNKICLTVSVGLRRYAALRFRKFFGLEIGLGTLRRLATKPRVSDDFLRQTGVGWVTPVDVALDVVTQVIEESTCDGK